MKKKLKTVDYHDFTTKDMSAEEREKIYVGDIWINEMTCKKCKETIRSMNLHDFKRCKCGAIFVDGGSHYQRSGGDPKDYESNIEYYDDIREDGDPS